MAEETETKVEGRNIPDLQIDAKNRIIEQTKEIPLKINGEINVVVVHKLNTGVRNKIKSECAKTTILGGQPQVKIDESEIQEKILCKAIIKAPFEFTTVADIKQLPANVTDYLFDEYNEFAEPSEKKNLKSENP